ncbi:MAG: thiol reductant ABC exporter subunit CydC [Peptococcaceae bacterium]|nr:thiol reductant ABC exporter subunit CydC [Peptococcaceae bacterium]
MRRSGVTIIWRLLKLVRPMTHIMLLCILMGTLGCFCATAITVLGANLLLTVADSSPWALTFREGGIAMGACVLLRAVLRYGEQTCGHYIAFKLLAILRDHVFGALRRLAPAKLEGKGRGDLISLITGDIELLEVFYAHTIAPVCIALLVSASMTALIGGFHPVLGFAAAVSYLIVGIVIPLTPSKMGHRQGLETRDRLGELNSCFLESLRGLRETLQYGRDAARAAEISEKTEELNRLQGGIKKREGAAASWSGLAVMSLTLVMLGMGLLLKVDFSTLLLATVMLSASFGPVLALANLTATIPQTLAAGERVMELLEEEPETADVLQGDAPDFSGAEVKNLSFAYAETEILHDLSARFPKGEIVAVTGKSGSGKSTLLKLLMRFWQAPQDSVLVSGRDVGQIETAHLRALESYMTQETDLFHDSIADNIRIGRPDAAQAEIEAAAKKASLHDFIMTLPKGYDTPVGELGETLSGGERQRIGLARAFLHDAPLMLLDEPTSNLDSLNEGVVLKALREYQEGRTVVLVSHRKSTLAIADRAYAVESGRLS